MKLIIGDELVEIDNLDDYYLDEGSEAVIYRYEDDSKDIDWALKIYKDYSRKVRLDYETALRLSQIKTNRILLPNKIISSESGEFLGYTTPFCSSYSIDNISRMAVRDFIDEVDLIYLDTKNLTDQSVSLDDINLMNMTYDGRIVLHDPGSYRFVMGENSRFLSSENFEMVNDFLLKKLIRRVSKLTREEIRNLDKYFYQADGYVTDLMRCDIEETEDVKGFFKRITKR